MTATEQRTHKGICFCGGVEVTTTGKPFAMGYCHCKDCRAWSAGPVNAFTLWSRDAVRVTRGADLLGRYQKTEASDRQFCTRCGGHVMTTHLPGDFIDVYAAILPSVEFEPEIHVNYESAVIRIKDGLPKLRDFPAEMGGSGDLMDE